MKATVMGWLASNPVRTYLYTVGVVLLVLLNAYGIIGDDRIVLWGNLLAVVFVPAVEAARNHVTPVASLPQTIPNTEQEK